MRCSIAAFALLAGLSSCVASAVAAPPLVFRVSDPVGPGETAMLFGDGIGPQVRAEGLQLPAGTGAPAAAENARQQAGPGAPLDVLQASHECAKVAIPPTWRRGMYVLWLISPSGERSAPVYLNHTEPWWWLGGENDTAYAGEEIRVFGKNLGHAPKAWLVEDGNVFPAKEFPLQPSSRPAEPSEPAGGPPLSSVPPGYSAQFTIPPGIAPGPYSLWIHNGQGGITGCGGPLPVKVAKRVPWPATRFNVRDHGAQGDGQADDTPAFEAALAAAAGGGGIVFVPRGTYKITASWSFRRRPSSAVNGANGSGSMCPRRRRSSTR
jgi:hypothetical protein